VFLLFQALPADPAALTCGRSCNAQVIAQNRIRLGYDKPLYVQYGKFVEGIFVGREYGSGTATFRCPAPCLGYSFLQSANVTDLIKARLPVTAVESVGACILWLLSGTLLGIIAALRRGKWQDRTLMGAALIGYSFPTFFIGLLLLYFVVFKFQIMAYPAYAPLATDPVAWLKSFILPWITLATVYAAFYARLTRNQMLDTLGEDYIRTARAKGLSERRTVSHHALRNVLIPVATVFGLDLGGLLGGAVITEKVFSMQGLGALLLDAVGNLDLQVLVGVTLFSAFVIVVANFVVDLTYGLLDPRVKARAG
jgi:peptide/nickel transport system permease protein